jgi:hypothetical protein
MTPKEKAYELVMYKFIEWTPAEEEYEVSNAKECALIAVDEILFLAQWTDESIYKYWQEVKQEIEKL